jgi:hypothetical protein
VGVWGWGCKLHFHNWNYLLNVITILYSPPCYNDGLPWICWLRFCGSFLLYIHAWLTILKQFNTHLTTLSDTNIHFRPRIWKQMKKSDLIFFLCICRQFIKRIPPSLQRQATFKISSILLEPSLTPLVSSILLQHITDMECVLCGPIVVVQSDHQLIKTFTHRCHSLTARANQLHPPASHAGWLVCGRETLFVVFLPLS